VHCMVRCGYRKAESAIFCCTKVDLSPLGRNRGVAAKSGVYRTGWKTYELLSNVVDCLNQEAAFFFIFEFDSCQYIRS